MSRDYLKTLIEVHARLDEDTAGKASEALGFYESNSLADDLDMTFSVCESPIERRFLLGLTNMGLKVDELEAHNRLADRLYFRHRGAPYMLELQCEEHHYDSNGAISSEPFARIDFVLRDIRYPWQLAIETDGHEFHEKTKEQAARDKKRDRALVARGYRIMRFAGSEVFASAKSCWEEVLEAAESFTYEIKDAVGNAEMDMRERLLEELTAPAAPKQLPAFIEAQQAATGATNGPTSSSASNDERAQDVE